MTKSTNLDPLPTPSEPLPGYGDTQPIDAPPLKKIVSPSELPVTPVVTPVVTEEIVKEVDKRESQAPKTIWPW